VRVSIYQQDYLFVRTFTYVTARARDIIPETQNDIRELLGNGYSALLEERRVFKENAERRKVFLPFTTEPEVNPDDESKKESSFLDELDPHFHPKCLEYAKWMVLFLNGEENRRKKTTKELLVFLWTIEKCYYEAFLFVQQSKDSDLLPVSIKSFVDWWSSDDFNDYINALEKMYNAVAAGVDHREEKKELHQIIAEILRLEALFWSSSRP
jgi:thiaminase